MEFFDKLGDWFTAFTGWIERGLTKIFGASNERHIRKMGFVRDKDGDDAIEPGSLLDRINGLEPEYEKLSEDELKQCATKFRARLAAGETLDDLLPDCYAAVRESSRRYLKMRHYDVQMIGGVILHRGMIAEMVTGEGKTLVATLPTALNALAGGVHVITVNDYLALRDMEWMGPVYMGLGLTVGAIQAHMDPYERQTAYACDITYGTNNEFGFDYLRDNMKPRADLQVQGDLNFALVDEIDNILIDEARTPLIISGPAHDDIDKYAKADRVSRQLKKGDDFEVKEKEHSVNMTESGMRKAEELAGVDSFYTVGNMEWPHLIDNSLKAHYLYKRDVNYVVEGGEVVIVDEFTGRKMEGRQWSDGLHQAVEAKEGVTIKAENQTLATITLQNYFKLYKKLAGMTGTAMTEASEFWQIYKLDVVNVPTNRPMRRQESTDLIYLSEREKWDAVVEEIREVHKTGRPILVGTVSIEKSEFISTRLNKFGIQHSVLNAKFHEKEAEIIAQAGRKGMVTIATNMAGRGTDIILGGNPEHMAWEELKQKYSSRLDVSKPEWDEITKKIAQREGMDTEGREVAALGGLHVVGTERHDSRRIDLQLRGRAGRQGDPGSSRFFLSLEDDLMRLFAGEWVKNMLTRLGMKEGEAIESRMVQKRVVGAQKKVEERHFDQRKHLLDYDEVMDDQRKRVYSYRQKILDGANCRELILDMIDKQAQTVVESYLDPGYRWASIVAWTQAALQLDVDVNQIEGMTRDQLEDFLRDECVRQAEDSIMEQVEVDLPEEAEDRSRDWNWLALSRFANARFGLNTNDRELKKIGRDDVFQNLLERAKESLQKNDYTPLDEYLADDYCERSLCDWLAAQFTLEVDPAELAGKEVFEVQETIRLRVEAMYCEKEVLFPVAVGMSNFLSDSHAGGERYNREGLIRWANDRFGVELSLDDFKNKPRTEIEHLLADASRRFYINGDVTNRVDEFLNQAYGTDEDRGSPRPTEDEQAEALDQLTRWANEEFKAEVDPDELRTLDRDRARQRLLNEYDERYRPELQQAERALLLEVLDTAWKDHLYHMDYLRSHVGLQGWAQKDPKTEYKREGRKAFNGMWDRIGREVTQAIFRLEKESPEFVGSLWEITNTYHEETNVGSDYFVGADSQLEPGETVEAVATIRNVAPKVGRNDPCPCGSGKKYKKCCGAN